MAKIQSIDELRRLYAKPNTRVVKKALTCLDCHHIRFIEHSPFLTISSASANGEGDVSPRGEGRGFVKVLDQTTLAIPDRPGNNRLDTLSNIIENAEVGLMFLIPGIGEVLRVNGTAEVRDDPTLVQRFSIDEKLPKTAIVVAVREAYLHCPKALMRSGLWESSAKTARSVFPSLNKMLHDQTGEGDVRETQQAMEAR